MFDIEATIGRIVEEQLADEAVSRDPVLEPRPPAMPPHLRLRAPETGGAAAYLLAFVGSAAEGGGAPRLLQSIAPAQVGAPRLLQSIATWISWRTTECRQLSRKPPTGW